MPEIAELGWKTWALELYPPVFCGQRRSEYAAAPEPTEVEFTLMPLAFIERPLVADALLICEPKMKIEGFNSSKVRSRSKCQAMRVKWSGSPGIIVLVYLVKLSIFSLVEEPDELLPHMV